MNSWRVLFMMAFLAVSLAACGGEAPQETELSTPVSPIIWERDPLHVVFRADIVGGERTQGELANHIPDCTIYGDGRVVWTTSGGNGVQVLFDFLPDLAIQDFVSFLTIDVLLFTFEEGFPLQLPQSITPVYEQIILEVSGLKHVTDSFGGWDGNLYTTVLEACRALAKTPRVFVPEGAWIGALPSDPTRDLPTVYWDSEAAGFNFSTLALESSTRWIEGNLVKALWAYIVEDPAEVEFDDRFGVYYVTLQVPGVTLNAPAAPAE